jgi:dihydroceramidase
LSSVPTLTVGLYFALKAHAHGYGFRFAFVGWMLAFVGFGSVAFHGTLTRFGQVLDELPMLYASSIFLWISASLSYPADQEGDARSAKLGYGLVLYCGAVTYAYGKGGFTFFFVAYALTVFAVAATTLKAARRSPSKSVAAPYASRAFGIYLGGFLALWVPEQAFCGNRLHAHQHSPLQDLPLPLHAFFHVTSSIGPLFWLTFASFESARREGRRPRIVRGRHWLLFGAKGPEVVPTRGKKRE